MKTRKSVSTARKIFPALLLLLVLAACGDDADLGPTSDARVQVLVTDAPSDILGSARIWVSAVYLQGGSEDDDDLDDDGIPDGEDDDVEGRVFLFEAAGDPIELDLLELRNGLTATLTGEVEVEPGRYGQLRIVVDSARVTLDEGFRFTDGSTEADLRVPSGSTSGIKVLLDAPIDADTGEIVTVLVDFDVDRNFVIQGNENSPAGIQGILFTPTLVELGRDSEDVDG